MKDEEFDNLLRNIIRNIPECSPPDDFVNKVMVVCCKEPFNIFVWLREKQTKLIVKLTSSIINIGERTIEDYKSIIKLNPQPIL